MNHGALEAEGRVKSSVTIEHRAALQRIGIPDPGTIVPLVLQSARGALVRSRGRGSESERSGQHGGHLEQRLLRRVM